MDDDKKVIFIKGSNSNWFEQAIFILKDKKKNNVPKDFVQEAEKIINNYMIEKYSLKKNLNSAYSKPAPSITKKQTLKKSEKFKRKKNFDRFLNVSIILCCISIGLILYYFN